MQDAEVESIMRTLVNSVQTYDEVVEVRSCCGRITQFSSLDPYGHSFSHRPLRTTVVFFP